MNSAVLEIEWKKRGEEVRIRMQQRSLVTRFSEVKLLGGALFN